MSEGGREGGRGRWGEKRETRREHEGWVKVGRGVSMLTGCASVPPWRL